jgi:glycosyltransferase involved in cell wall biosynthesis
VEKYLLIIAYHYPPDPVSNPYPTASWVKHLPDYGWTPVILTSISGEATTFKSDRNVYRVLRAQAFKRLVIWRRRLPTAWLSFKLLNFVLINFLLYPDDKRGWFANAYRAGLSIAEKHPLAMILSIGTPWTDHWVASTLSRKLNIPWIADYRDPWTQKTSAPPRRKWFIHDSICRFIEKRIDKTCSCGLHASDIWADQLGIFLRKKVFSIPNGYDSDDFSHVAELKPTGSKLNISYVGTLHFPQQLKPFFEGFKTFIEQSNVSEKECQLNFVGTGEIPFLKKKDPLLKRFIKHIPYTSKEDAITYMAKSHILLLFLSDDTGWYPTKAFEYLASGNIILASPDNGGVINELLERAKAGTVSKDAEHVARWLGEKIREFREHGYLTLSPNRQYIERFERKKLTQRLAGILDGVYRG